MVPMLVVQQGMQLLSLVLGKYAVHMLCVGKADPHLLGEHPRWRKICEKSKRKRKKHQKKGNANRPFQKAQLLTLVEYRSEKQCLRVKKVCTLGWIDHNRCTMEWIITAAMIFVYFSCIFVDFNVFLWNLMDLCCLNVIHEFFVDLRNLFVDLTDFLWI
ncbi:uncharacterized protein LOC122300139 isoform X1 [Carya illinoinensis]|uniref:uncharacterized protein LOC122300139 isoform X1 n=1 Tax=Carya illinoinensis TaxID=32201 RepID=UPI001C717F38|nr:uncharacterized protein LOC122300139 isoform X1 [Carya illinoinensis]